MDGKTNRGVCSSISSSELSGLSCVLSLKWGYGVLGYFSRGVTMGAGISSRVGVGGTAGVWRMIRRFVVVVIVFRVFFTASSQALSKSSTESSELDSPS